MNETQHLDSVTSALLELRLKDQPPKQFADVERPRAYAIQRELSQALGESVAGWKVAIDSDGVPIAAPLLASTMAASGQSVSLPANRPMKIETELAVRLGSDLPPREQPYERQEIVAAIAAIGSAFELAAPYVGEPPEAPFGLFLADYLGNYRNVLGPFEELPQPYEESRDELFLDGELVGTGAHPRSDPLAPLLAYANSQFDTFGGMKAGQVVITGSYTKPRLVERPGAFKGHVLGLPPVEVAIAAAG